MITDHEEEIVTREESNRRLTVLADFLDKLPEGRFDYSIWVGHDWQGDPSLSCGTTACALGWATAIPEFFARGLFLDKDLECVLLDHQGDFLSGSDAGAVVFGLLPGEAFYLFSPATYLYDENRGHYVDPEVWPRSPSEDAPPPSVSPGTSAS